MAKKQTQRQARPAAGGDLAAQMLASSAAEMRARGWREVDVVLVTGDAYVDHPAFGAALIGRWLAKHGYRVAVLAQPDWREVGPFRQFGRPRLFWGITSGAVDARVNAYTSLGQRRREDAYSPGGQLGWRPDRPLQAYAARAREAFKGVPIILGGVEASLRRLVHYDYIEEQLKRSVLIDAKADLLVHGMGEQAVLTIAERLAGGAGVEQLRDIPGTAYPLHDMAAIPAAAVVLPSLAAQRDDPRLVMTAYQSYAAESHPAGRPVVQPQDPGVVVALPPAPALSETALETVYALPFTRCAHPRYDAAGGVPALETVQFSITAHRGCFGGCNFCAIYHHQGKAIRARSTASILAEAEACRRHPAFRGTISDVGGPTANMYGMACPRAEQCVRVSCLFPEPCPQARFDDGRLLELMEALRRWRTAKGTNVFVASGVRHDLALRSREYMKLLCGEFVGGHLKVAPEHNDSHVLRCMGKPDFSVFEAFEREFAALSRACGKEQYLVPYFITAHPGCDMDAALGLGEYLMKRNWQVRQVQDFTPTPLTAATAMQVSGLDLAGKPIPVAQGRREKRLQAALVKYHLGESRKLVVDFFRQRGRGDLAAAVLQDKRPGGGPARGGRRRNVSGRRNG